ncbi:MAG: polysaccharide biosynthesis/export family protein [Rhodosalinus sp.]
MTVLEEAVPQSLQPYDAPPSQAAAEAVGESVGRPQGLLSAVFRALPPDGDDCSAGQGEDRILPGDRIELRVFERPASGEQVPVAVFERLDFSGDLTVDGAGMIAVPAAGRLPASEATLSCLERRVEKALSSALLVEVIATASFAERPPVFVRGDVLSPGSYTHRPGLTVAEILLRAGERTAVSAFDERNLSLEARRNELDVLWAGLTLQLRMQTAQLEGRSTLDLSESQRAALEKALGADRVRGEAMTLQAAAAANVVRETRDTRLLADQETRIEDARLRLAAAEDQLATFSARRQALRSYLDGECRSRCTKGRRNLERQLETVTLRTMELELLVLDKRRQVSELEYELRGHRPEAELAEAEQREAQLERIRETLARRNEVDAQLTGVDTQLKGLSLTGEAPRVVIRRHGAQTQLIASEDTLVRPGDIVTVSRRGEAEELRTVALDDMRGETR